MEGANGLRRSKIVLAPAIILSMLLAIAAPVSAQPSTAEGSAAASSGTAPPPQASQGFPVRVTEDGYVSEGYDLFVWCGNVSGGVSDEYVRAEFEATRHAVEEGALDEDAAPSEQELRARLEKRAAEQARACEEAGFPTAEAPPARTEAVAATQPGLPDTGGAPSLPLAAGLLLTVVGLIALRATR